MQDRTKAFFLLGGRKPLYKSLNSVTHPQHPFNISSVVSSKPDTAQKKKGSFQWKLFEFPLVPSSPEVEQRLHSPKGQKLHFQPGCEQQIGSLRALHCCFP